MPIKKNLEEWKAKGLGGSYIGPKETWKLECPDDLEFTGRGIQYKDSHLIFSNMGKVGKLTVDGTIAQLVCFITIVICSLGGAAAGVNRALPMVPFGAVIAVFTLLALFVFYGVWGTRYLAFQIFETGGSIVISMDMSRRNIRDLEFLRQRVVNNIDNYRMIFNMTEGGECSTLGTSSPKRGNESSKSDECDDVP